MDVVKIDDSNISVTQTSVPVVTTTVFNYDDLLEQRKTIQDQKDRDNTQRDVELANVDALLAECKRLKLLTQAEIATMAVPIVSTIVVPTIPVIL